ncbi:hypothetical protein B1218_37595, partial [Pseudomonas ogarae]
MLGGASVLAAPLAYRNHSPSALPLVSPHAQLKRPLAAAHAAVIHILCRPSPNARQLLQVFRLHPPAPHFCPPPPATRASLPVAPTLVLPPPPASWLSGSARLLAGPPGAAVDGAPATLSPPAVHDGVRPSDA